MILVTILLLIAPLTTPTTHSTTPPILAPGLQNQGNTCYLNSVLQTIFHLPAFRTSVINSANGDDGLGNVLNEMESLSRQLEGDDVASSRSATTNKLTLAMNLNPYVACERAVSNRIA